MTGVQRPIILLGAPRSGTTLLGQLLRRHPDVAYLNEPRLMWRFGNDRRSDALRPVHATGRVREHIHAAFAKRLLEEGRTRAVEKTPANCLRVGFIDSVFPDAVYLHITRDGREAVPAIMNKWLSKGTGLAGARERQRLCRRLQETPLRQMPYYLPELIGRVRGADGGRPWGPRLPGLGEMVRDLPLIEVCAAQWRSCVEGVLSHRVALGDRLLELRLEDLTPGTLDAVFAHVGLPNDRETVDEFERTYQVAKVRGRSSSLLPSQRDFLESLLRPTLRELGYA